MHFIIGFSTIQPWRLFWSIKIILVLTPLGVPPNIYQIYIFLKTTKKSVKKEIKNLEISKTVQDSDMPVKISKENAEFFSRTSMLQI